MRDPSKRAVVQRGTVALVFVRSPTRLNDVMWNEREHLGVNEVRRGFDSMQSSNTLMANIGINAMLYATAIMQGGP